MTTYWLSGEINSLGELNLFPTVGMTKSYPTITIRDDETKL